MTLICNLFGGPGAGKSTTRAGVFHKLKLRGHNVEEVTEVAKDLTWEKRAMALACQPYVFGRQLKNMERLIGQVDIVVTDSPLLLGAYYVRLTNRYPASLTTFIRDQFLLMGGLNFCIKRVKPYNPIGRNQTEEQAKDIDVEVRRMLAEMGISYTEVIGDEKAVDIIVGYIEKVLNGQ